MAYEAKFTPFPFYADDVPVDISFVFENEKPAGKHGFLKIEGENFYFEDGTLARFWGTNINGGANFPDFEYSEKFAKRLAKIGLNLVRFHQLDAEWDTPNIFQFTKGPRCTKTTDFDPESMKRLDYLIYCLKKEGIYCYMDLLTYRRFKTEDGVANAWNLPDAAKGYSLFDPRIIELQKKFAYDIWNHINPYTGLAYKDDPVFVMGEVTNEDDLDRRPLVLEPYVTEFRQMFREWGEAKGVTDYDYDGCDVNDKEDRHLGEFKGYLTDKYYKEMIEYFREIGVKIPYAGTNYTLLYDPIYRAQLSTDFVDYHWYLVDWSEWTRHEKRCTFGSMMGDDELMLLQRVFGMRTHGKPLFISEWDAPWPNEFRAESTLYLAALGLLQNWSGFAIHTYSYGTRLNEMKIIGRELSSPTVGNVSYRQGMFSTWNDPAKFGLFYHAALMTRRGDVKPSQKKYAVKPQWYMQDAIDNLKGGYELSQVGVDLGLTEAEIIEPGERIPGSTEKERLSDTKQIYRNLEKKYGYIDTDMTKAFCGFLGENGKLEINDLSVECKNDYAVIAISSLTDEPINCSKNMLLTAVGRAQNTGFKFENGVMTDYGEPPIQIEIIEATVKIKTSVPNLRVWAVNAEGFYVAAITGGKYEDGVFSFKLGEEGSSMYYMIQAE